MRRALPAGLLLLAVTVSTPARADKEFTPRGVQMELMPAASFCLPTLVVDCKSDNGTTGPLVGGNFTIGYRPVRPVLIGVGYNVGLLMPDYERPDLSYELRYKKPAHLHAVFGQLRGIWGIKRWELAAEFGAGYSYLSFDTEGEGRRYSQGFAAKVAPVVAYWPHDQVSVGIKADFIFNLHTKFCAEQMGQKSCQRRADTEQVPIHQVLPGVLVGFLF